MKFIISIVDAESILFHSSTYIIHTLAFSKISEIHEKFIIKR